MMRFLRKILLGPTYFYHVFLIRKSKHWKKSDIEDYYNKKKLSKDLHITTKDDIKNHTEKYLRKSLFVPLREVRTGGTSGQPFKFFQDLFFTRQKERAYLFDIWSYVGYKGFDFKIVVRGNIPKRDIKYDFINNSLIISQNYFVEENKEKILQIFHKKDFFLHVYPSTLMFLIDFFGEKRFEKFPIKGVLAGSEAFPIQQMKWFEGKFNIPVAHWYGHSEYAILARYCKSCSEFHFYPTYGKMDLYEEAGSYKILATGFHKYGTQFNKYTTGDYAEISMISCNSDNFEKVNSIVGREQDFIFDKKGVKRAFGPYLFGIHDEFWDSILEIQFVQNYKGEINVLYVPSNNYNEVFFKKIIFHRFSLYDVDFEEVDFIEKTLSGKHIYFKQLAL